MKFSDTRIKDFIDLWTLTRGDLKKDTLADAIERCFTRRGTEFDLERFDEIVGDKEFLEILNKSKLKKFPTIETPPMKEMLVEIRRTILSKG